MNITSWQTSLHQVGFAGYQAAISPPGKMQRMQPVITHPKQRAVPRFGYGETFINLGNAVFIGALGVTAAYVLASIGGAIAQNRVNKSTRPENTIGTVKALVSGVEAAITPDRKVFIGGKLAGTYTPEGEVFAANGLKMGHADDEGRLYSVFSDQPVGWIKPQWNEIVLRENPDNKDLFANIYAPDLPKKEQAAVGLILYKHHFP